MSEQPKTTRKMTAIDVELGADENALVIPSKQADTETQATVTLELRQDAALLGGKTVIATIALEVEGATLATTAEELGIAWKTTGKVDPFGDAILTKGARVKAVGAVERHESPDHLVRSRCGRGKFKSAAASAPKTDRGGFMFAPAETEDDELTPAWLWKNASPKLEKVFCVGVKLEGETAAHRLPVLHPASLAGDDRFQGFTLTLECVVKLTAGEEHKEHVLAGPHWEIPAFEFLDDATKQAAGTLETQLIKEYGNPKVKPPLHARDWVGTLTDASAVGKQFRQAISTAVTWLNAHLPPEATFTLSEWDLAVTFLTEGGYGTLRSAIGAGDLKQSYSGYGDLGIDSFVTRWRSNSNGIRGYTAPTLTEMINKNTNLDKVTNEVGDHLETFLSLGVQDACYAVGGLLVESGTALSRDLVDATVVGPWTMRADALPPHARAFWMTLYYNTGTANGKSTLKNQGVKYHDNIWFYVDDHYQYARFEKFNANWRTATYRLMRAAYPTWSA
ncbi:MAG: hypothetical protein AB7N76_14615 [Planctomycetota bacterium]